MKHSPKFAMVNKFYNIIKPDGSRMWSKAMVKNAVVKKWITADEFKEITGEVYA